ncbi:MATE efflux family protein 9 [Spatholobus suberectus]|nr:MATE efflux family protein 9 [Spatholobus suberectus]
MMGEEETTPLLSKSEVNNGVAPSEDAFWVELKRVGSMAAPMVAATISQYLLEVVSLMMVGHLGILVSFSGVAIATSFAEVTGFCVVLVHRTNIGVAQVTCENLNTTTLHYIIPYAVGASASTRISNELGAGNPKAAQGIVRVVVILGIVDAIIVSTFLVCCRHILGYAYSNDKEVVDYVADMVPLLCVAVSADSLVGALSGEFLFAEIIYVLLAYIAPPTSSM